MAYHGSQAPTGNLWNAINAWNEFFGPAAEQRKLQMAATQANTAATQQSTAHQKEMMPGEVESQKLQLEQGRAASSAAQRNEAIATGMKAGGTVFAKLFDALQPTDQAAAQRSAQPATQAAVPFKDGMFTVPKAIPSNDGGATVAPQAPQAQIPQSQPTQPAFTRQQNIAWQDAPENLRQAFVKAMPQGVTADMYPEIWRKTMEAQTGRPTDVPGMWTTGGTVDSTGQKSFNYQFDPFTSNNPNRAFGSNRATGARPDSLTSETPYFESQPTWGFKTGPNGMAIRSLVQTPLGAEERAFVREHPEDWAGAFHEDRQPPAKEYAKNYLEAVKEFRGNAEKNHAYVYYMGSGEKPGLITLKRGVDALVNRYRNPETGEIDWSSVDPMTGFSLIFSEGKVNDPNAVIRQQEFENLAGMSGAVDQVKNVANRILTGQKFPPALLKNIYDTVNARVDAAKEGFAKSMGVVETRANRRNIPMEDLIDDPDALFDYRKLTAVTPKSKEDLDKVVKRGNKAVNLGKGQYWFPPDWGYSNVTPAPAAPAQEAKPAPSAPSAAASRDSTRLTASFVRRKPMMAAPSANQQLPVLSSQIQGQPQNGQLPTLSIEQLIEMMRRNGELPASPFTNPAPAQRTY